MLTSSPSVASQNPSQFLTRIKKKYAFVITLATMMMRSAATRALVRRAPTARAVLATNARCFSQDLNYGIVQKGNHGEFQEYSVIHTNRSLNLMSTPFQQVMRDLNKLLKTTYNADKVAIIPG